MAKRQRAWFYASDTWINTRRSYTKSVGGLCERCYAKGIIRPAEVVHHKIPINDTNIHDPNISLSWNNLEALCTDCHALVHSNKLKEREQRRYSIDKNGKVVVK